MKVFFAGTPDIAVASLEKINSKHEVVGVLTNPDRGFGRGRGVKSSPVKMKADELGLKTFQPEKLDDSFIAEVRGLGAELLAVVAYGQIFKEDFLDIFPRGGINVHPSLLPRFRGASPVQSALLSGDSETGISIQRLSLKMDSGAVLKQERYNYDGTETGASLTEYFGKRGAELLLEVIGEIESGISSETQQDDSKATYCSYIKKEDGLIDWNLSAAAIERKLRAFTPWPGIYTFLGDKKLNIIEAAVYSGGEYGIGVSAETEESVTASGSVSEDYFSAGSVSAGSVVGIDKVNGILIKTGHGILAVKRLQLQAKKALDWKSFLNGVKNFDSAVLGG